ncbi:uncharacterized protein LOC108912761 [Anoplophora glabripennis]|uniref:uncharacterized protein LOC108912761 n=1 Tax=Anoplophora glabripennis TaxID=217634 RepID=UPI000873EDD4|nr:uncharacterized protein LOC108912761 [Anoplophora glabripennis]
MEKRGKYGKWSENELQLAVDAFRRGGIGLNECAKVYHIPKATLKRHIENKNKIANAGTKKFGKGTILPKDVEEELVKHIIKLEEMMFGLTITDIRKLAFEIAAKNNIAHKFSMQKGLAGKKWYYAFMRRHPTLTLRQPESTSIARARGFNRQNVYHFFDILERINVENKLDATRIYNVDESGFSTVQKKSQKIIGLKGKKQIGAIASGERGVNTTMVCCVSAAGQFIPPMLIFKRMIMSPELKVGAPPGSLVEISGSGYINSELFCKWLQHFISVVKPNEEMKVLLLLDGHSTHSKNLDALMLARENGVILLQLPGHTTHRLQPLDVFFFKPMETYYTQAMERWLRTNPGMKVTQFQVSELLSEAYGKAACIQTAVNGFKAAGIWPIDRGVFADHQFAAADNLCQEEQPMEDAEINGDGSEENREDNPLESLINERRARANKGPSTSGTNRNATNDEVKKSSLNVSIEELSPVPVPTKTQRLSKGAQKAEELTSTPYKDNLIVVKEKTARRKGKQQKNLLVLSFVQGK